MNYPFSQAVSHPTCFLQEESDGICRFNDFSYSDNCMINGVYFREDESNIEFVPNFSHTLQKFMQKVGPTSVLNPQLRDIDECFFEADKSHYDYISLPSLIDPIIGEILQASQDNCSRTFSAPSRPNQSCNSDHLVDPVRQKLGTLPANLRYLGNGLLACSRIEELNSLCLISPDVESASPCLEIHLQSPNFEQDSFGKVDINNLGNSTIHAISARYDANLHLLIRHCESKEKVAYLKIPEFDQNLHSLVKSLDPVNISTDFSVIDEALNPFFTGFATVTGRSINESTLTSQACCSVFDLESTNTAFWRATLSLDQPGEDCISEACIGVGDSNSEYKLVTQKRSRFSNAAGFRANQSGMKIDQSFTKLSLDPDPVGDYASKFHNQVFIPTEYSNLSELFRICLDASDAKKSIKENWGPQQISSNFSKLRLLNLQQSMAFSHAGFFLRCGHGTLPSIITLASPRRDVYSLLGVGKNIHLVDKRMPNHMILSWLVPFNRVPAYLKFVEKPSHWDASCPDVLAMAGSQFPWDAALWGLNLKTGYPQVLGPSMPIDNPLNLTQVPYFGSCRLDGVAMAGLAVSCQDNCITASTLSSRGDILQTSWAWRSHELELWNSKQATPELETNVSEIEKGLLDKKKKSNAIMEKVMAEAKQKWRDPEPDFEPEADVHKEYTPVNRLKVNKTLDEMLSSETNSIEDPFFEPPSTSYDKGAFEVNVETDYPVLLEDILSILQTGMARELWTNERDQEELDREKALTQDAHRFKTGLGMPISPASAHDQLRFVLNRHRGSVNLNRKSLLVSNPKRVKRDQIEDHFDFDEDDDNFAGSTVRLKRFIAKLAEVTPPPLSMPAVDWASFSDDCSHIFKLYPIMRKPILVYLKPVFDQFLKVWSQHPQHAMPEYLLQAQINLMLIVQTLFSVLNECEEQNGRDLVDYLSEWIVELIYTLRPSADILLSVSHLEPTSSPKQQMNDLLDTWALSPVVPSLLGLLADCLLTPLIKASTVKPLLRLLLNSAGYMLQWSAHWCLDYLLLYSFASKQCLSQGVCVDSRSRRENHSTEHLVHALLDAALQFPPPQKLTQEIRESWDRCIYAALLNATFLGEECPVYIKRWFSKKMEACSCDSSQDNLFARLIYLALKIACFHFNKWPREQTKPEPANATSANFRNNSSAQNKTQNLKIRPRFNRLLNYKTEKHLVTLNAQAEKICDLGLELLGSLLEMSLTHLHLMSHSNRVKLVKQFASVDFYDHAFLCLLEALSSEVIISMLDLGGDFKSFAENVLDLYLLELIKSKLVGQFDPTIIGFLKAFSTIAKSARFVKQTVANACTRRAKLTVLISIHEQNSSISELLQECLLCQNVAGLNLVHSILQFHRFLTGEDSVRLLKQLLIKILTHESSQIQLIKNLVWLIDHESKQCQRGFAVSYACQSLLNVFAKILYQNRNNQLITICILALLSRIVTPDISLPPGRCLSFTRYFLNWLLFLAEVLFLTPIQQPFGF
ncbi:hypothetical protein Ciccas_001642 [Cichlidogyrus casuarinus]|uniref:Uncharacterized protein n=1 Tax=Cichlidogyrus casuarinus TaxID=1844966 RepID=A0ABD2QJI6_9PLAT